MQQRRWQQVAKTTPYQREKLAKVFHEAKTGQLRSGSKHGPVVKNRKQIIAIALSEAGLARKK